MEKIFINGIEMKPGMDFGRGLSIADSENKTKFNKWIEEDNWEIKNG